MSNYSTLNKILHRQFLDKGEILNFSLNRIKDKSENFSFEKSNHIFITGLARSGTTALLQFLDNTNKYGSLRYKYMPFILLPRIAKFYAEFFSSKDFIETERLHGDGLKISSKSPECLDEPFWKNMIYQDSNLFEKYLLPHNVSMETARAYAYLLDRYKRIENNKNLVIKNNNNHLRLLSLSKYFPNSNFMVVFRSPIAHATSLCSLHKRLLDLQKKDKFILEYMNMLGHWEFGDGMKPFIYHPKQLEDLVSRNPISIEYWVTQWIYTYEWILEELSINKNKNIKLICYEELCSNDVYKSRIFNSLKVSHKKSSFKFKAGKSNYVANNLNLPDSVIKKSQQIYDALKKIP